jgi:hypothetical protein
LSAFSDFVVFADESGDHGMASIDADYPVFVLVFCLMRKAVYTSRFIPELHGLKFRFWGHDSVVLHEHDIRMETGPFGVLRSDRALRHDFYDALNELLVSTEAEFIVALVDKPKHRSRYPDPWN